MQTPQASSHYTKHEKFARCIFTFCAISTTLPISAGYLSVLLLVVWMILGRHEPVKVDLSLADQFDRIVYPIHLAVIGLTICHLLGALLAFIFSQDAPSVFMALRPSAHIVLKWNILWFLLAFGVRSFMLRGGRFVEISKWLCIWLLLHFAYCLAQRYTGVDWSHGLFARLGPNRFAYGVYRVSGFMGHPLSLVYNLVLLGLCALPLSCFTPVYSYRLRWSAITGLALMTLMIGGSRFPLVAFFATLLICFHRQLWILRSRILIASAVIVIILYLEGSILLRIREFFAGGLSLTERFDRWVFWQAHWQVFIEHPFFGTGMWAIDTALEEPYRVLGYTHRMYGAHNIFLQQMADGGIIGLSGILILLLGLFVSAKRAKFAYRSWNPLMALAWGAIASGLLQNNFRDSEFVFCFWLCVAISAAEAASSSRADSHRMTT